MKHPLRANSIPERTIVSEFESSRASAAAPVLNPVRRLFCQIWKYISSNLDSGHTNSRKVSRGMLGEERKREIEAEEAARAAEEAYRREVRLRMTQADPLPSIAARSLDPVDKAKSGLNFFQILGLVALAAAIAYVYATYNADVSRATRAAKAAAAPLRSKPRYVPMKEPIASGQIVVRAGGWVTYRLRIKPAMRNAVFSGSFNASGGTGNDVSAVVACESEFQNWINGHEARVLYSTRDRKTTDSFTVALPEGEYIFAISNKFSIFSMKTVFLNADLRYDVLAEPQSNLFSGVQSGL